MTCPKCGGMAHGISMDCLPPIVTWRCSDCGWWISEQDGRPTTGTDYPTEEPA